MTLIKYKFNIFVVNKKHFIHELLDNHTTRTIGAMKTLGGYDRIVQELCNKVFNDEEITLAEEYFVGGIIEQLRIEKGDRAFKIEDYGRCENYRFRSRYLRYVNDLNGHKDVMDYDGPIPTEQKRKDCRYPKN